MIEKEKRKSGNPLFKNTEKSLQTIHMTSKENNRNRNKKIYNRKSQKTT